MLTSVDSGALWESIAVAKIEVAQEHDTIIAFRVAA
jgi:hypothetical protein